jgi:hypothetical protein
MTRVLPTAVRANGRCSFSVPAYRTSAALLARLDPSQGAPISFGLNRHFAIVANYATLYRELQAIVPLFFWVYGLASSFLFGAEFVVQWTEGSRLPRQTTVGRELSALPVPEVEWRRPEWSA